MRSASAKVASIAAAFAILLGIGATFIVLRSISRPLDEVVGAMAGITAGNLSAPIPAARTGRDRRDGAHAATVPRQHHGARAAVRAERAQRRMIETAVETISDGFVSVRFGRPDRAVQQQVPRDLSAARGSGAPGDAVRADHAGGGRARHRSVARQDRRQWIAERVRAARQARKARWSTDTATSGCGSASGALRTAAR